LVSENYINNYSNQGISINNVENGIFINNIFGESNSPHAIQMINGGKDIKIAGNKFKNAGRFNILINARRLNLVSVSQSTNAVFTCAQDVASLDAFVGKRIFIRNAEGMTQLNNRYYTITNINGKTFQVGLDTSSYTPYIGGGIVQERYRDISITNNKFTHEKYPVGFSDSRSFYGYDYQSVILKNNECYYNSSLPNLGGFLALNLANTYIDDSQNPVRTTGISNLTGSNLVVPFID
jgi:hypothetical protein